MTPEAIRALILQEFPETEAHEAWGETSLFCNPGGRFARGADFLTLKSKDGAHDRASALDRPEVFRMNPASRAPCRAIQASAEPLRAPTRTITSPARYSVRR